ncbi:MAG: bifunctional acetate--CoA ligase family protein/GNAT family N-acetyltransferase [Gammaproteobacteria bacterium]|nr:bifunctional acetate--CoA ligase family protein/GNAT family N-acetyltransferase [Gammaproteobacteria bacterium]MBU1653937.1 bifunctional acetate--CoA ligase family protein/GNAT family N-acetyltransferase [Gammaproteobacteria bacterium]MBU1962605.1 bifunctional acetate--CoA ligase family protein/GNAT family N-acetyltransferase [Gammaproteobacteria bacterium]
MGPHFLDSLFSPQAIAVFGASERPNSVGMRIFRNLLDGGYSDRVYPINPSRDSVQGRDCYKNLSDIGEPVDLAIIATPAPSVKDVIRQCGEYGVKVAVVLSAGFREVGEAGQRMEQELKETASLYNLRLVGPNCLGFMRPPKGIDATFLDSPATPGKLALVSQSGALCTAILDWAAPHKIGFSAVVSMGNAADVDFGDLLDFLALDPHTHAILLYIEGISHARRFISGLRTASRMKPIVVLKAGRNEGGSKAAATHTGALIGSDAVFGAALERAGVVRAYSIGQLFAAAELLASGAKVKGNRLTIVTNGGGPGALATDRAEEVGVRMAELAPETLERFNQLLPAHWSHGNPVDILGDAPPERYGEAVGYCLEDKNCDGVLALLTPQAMTQPTQAAESIVEAINKHPGKPVLACWMGETSVAEARLRMSELGLPHFLTPERAVESFSYLAKHQRNQRLLLQTPDPVSDQRAPDVAGARLIIEGVLGEGREMLSDTESKAILSAFHIPTVQTHEIHSANEALIAAESLGFPVALKISSPQISHKSDAGGVELNVASAQDVRSAYLNLIERVKANRPHAEIRGVTVESMAINPNARELMVGVVRDPVFGPAISFGAGGTAVEIHKDSAVALPPLNEILARRLIERTRVAKLLEPFRHMPAVDFDAVLHVLLRISEMVCELPHLVELDINPLLAHEKGVIAVDARMVVRRPRGAREPYSHMAIHPYPSHLATRTQLPDGTNVLIRPIRPEDANIEQDFVRKLTPQSRYLRFMQSIKELTPEMLVRFTQPDYDREMALIALVEKRGVETAEIGVCRYNINPDGRSCEFALVVGDEWHKKGIGTLLMNALMEAARNRGLSLIEGDVLAENSHMLDLCNELGFTIQPSKEDPALRVVRRRL